MSYFTSDIKLNLHHVCNFYVINVLTTYLVVWYEDVMRTHLKAVEPPKKMTPVGLNLKSGQLIVPSLVYLSAFEGRQSSTFAVSTEYL